MNEPLSPTRKSNRKILWISATVVVLAGGWWFFGRTPKQVDTKIETEEVTRGPLRETVSATGALQALETIPVGTQVSGTIDTIYVDFNDKVKKGQLLARIDASVLDSQLESARAALAQATARQVDAVAALKEGEALLAKAYISDKDLRTLKTNVATTAAQVESAMAEYNRAKRNRQYADIHSPIDGVVIERAVDRGQTVASGFQTPTLFTIAEDLNKMQIVASVDESQIGSIQVSQNASFSVSAFPGRKFAAAVKQIRLKPTTQQNVVTYAVVLSADNPKGDLYPGMTATVDFVLKDLDDTLRVPSAALRIQRLPDELMDEETKKRMQEMQAMRDGGASKRPAGAGEGGPTPEQIQAMRQQRLAQNGSAGGAGGTGRANMGNVWVMQADGTAKRLAVRILGSDMSATAVEPVRGELKAGDKVITKVTTANNAQQAQATRSLLPGPPQGGGGQRR
jgi:HlyD family secretion protein